jgi:hypothetical protein
VENSGGRGPEVYRKTNDASQKKRKNETSFFFLFSFFYFEKPYFLISSAGCGNQKKRGVFMGCEKIGCLIFLDKEKKG